MSTKIKCGLTQRAPDGWDCARFLELFLSFGSFPLTSLFSPQPPVTHTVSPLQQSLVVNLFMKTRVLFLISLLAMANLRCTASARDSDQDHFFTKTEPPKEQLVGNYLPTAETISLIEQKGHYQFTNASISLYPDGNFEMQNMPDWWLPNDAGYGKSDGGLDSGLGIWAVSKEDLSGLWQLTLLFESGIFDGVPGSFTIALDLSGEQPPYSIWIYVGNPDRGRVMVFQQEVRNP